MSDVGSQLPSRLLHCYSMKIALHKGEVFPKRKSLHNVQVETSRKALDLSLKLNGKQHENTASWYLKTGLFEKIAENYIAAFDAFDQVIEILKIHNDRSSCSNGVLAKAYIGKGEIYGYLKKFELAIQSFKEALAVRRKLFDENTTEIAEVLFLIACTQLYLNELTSALATYERVLKIMLKLHANKCCPSSNIILCYGMLAQVHHELGNIPESGCALKTAIEIETDNKFAQCCIFYQLLNLGIDESLYMKFLNGLHLNGEEYNPMLATVHSQLAAKQLESEKCKDGLVSLREALNIELEDILLSHLIFRESTVASYLNVAIILVKIEKSYFAKSVIERTAKIAESLPECKQHLYLFRCYTLKGRIHNQMREYVAAIESLDHALLQLPKLSHDDIYKSQELLCHVELTRAYLFQMSYEKALTSSYHALSVSKDVFPEESEVEGGLYLFVAASQIE